MTMVTQPSIADSSAAALSSVRGRPQRPSILLHVIDDPEPLLSGGPLPRSALGAALLGSLPNAAHKRQPRWLDELPRPQPAFAAPRHFLNAHSAAPVCQPSRWALLTGRYATSGTANGSQHVFFNMRPVPRATSLPGILQRRGYRTGFVGKYHAHMLHGSYSEMQAQVRSLGFDQVRALYAGNLGDAANYVSSSASGDEKPPPLFHLPEWGVSHAIAFLRAGSNTRSTGSGGSGGGVAAAANDGSTQPPPPPSTRRLPPFFLSFNPTLEHAPFAPSLCTSSWRIPDGQEWDPSDAEREASACLSQARSCYACYLRCAASLLSLHVSFLS